MNLVDEGLDIWLRSGGTGHARTARHSNLPGGTGLAAAPAVAESAGVTSVALGTHCVHLPRSDRLLRRGLVGADGAAFSEGHIGLRRTVLDVGTVHPRTTIRIIYTVVYFYSPGSGFILVHVVIIARIIFVAIAVVVIKILRVWVWVWFGLRSGDGRAH